MYIDNNQYITEDQNELSIKDLFFLFFKNWYWFVLSFIVVMTAALFFVLRSEPQYTRTATIHIKDDSKGGSIDNSLDAFTDLGLTQSNTKVIDEVGILQSPASMADVVRRLSLDVEYWVDGNFHDELLYGATLPIKLQFLDLDDASSATLTVDVNPEEDSFKLKDITRGDFEFNDNKEFFSFSDTVNTPIGRVIVDKTPFYNENNLKYFVKRRGIDAEASAILKRLDVALNDDKGNLINITIEDYSKQRGDDIISTLIDVYNDNWIKDKNQIAVSTSLFINERLAVIERELGGVDENISSYKSTKLVPDVQAASSMYLSQKTQTDNQILELNNQIYMARYIKTYLTTVGNETQLLPANSGIGSGSIDDQISDYNDKLLRRNDLAANSSDNNPLVVDADNALTAIRTAIISSIDNQITTLNEQLSSLRQLEVRTTQQLASNPTQAQYLLSVERQQKVKESLYLFLLQKREENELSQAFSAYNTRIITPPYGADKPSSPQKNKIYLIAFLLAMFLPAGVLYLKEVNDTKVRSAEDIKKLSVPFIGDIPQYGKSGKKKAMANLIVVKEGKRDAINEAFRVVRTNIDFMTTKNNACKTFQFTSYNIGSGKSFISLNLAIAYAIKGRKVLVIDGDMRHASVSAYVNSPKRGMSDYLSGKIDNVRDVIVDSKKHPSLHMLPVGTIPPNPAELLMEERFSNMLSDLRREYDYIFIDSAPLNVVADTQIISQNADYMIFIVRTGVMERKLLDNLEQLYNDKKYNNLSVILNGTEMSGRYYSYGGKYSYGYYSKEEKS